jgi:hypothetical protein
VYASVVDRVQLTVRADHVEPLKDPRTVDVCVHRYEDAGVPHDALGGHEDLLPVRHHVGVAVGEDHVRLVDEDYRRAGTDSVERVDAAYDPRLFDIATRRVQVVDKQVEPVQAEARSCLAFALDPQVRLALLARAMLAAMMTTPAPSFCCSIFHSQS